MKWKREFIKFMIIYFVSVIIKSILKFSYNPFIDEFNIVLFLASVGIWTFSYVLVHVATLLFIKFNI